MEVENVMSRSPVALFVYNRKDVLSELLGVLSSNPCSGDTILFVFSDGPKNDEDNQGVQEVRQLLKTVKGFKQINIINRKENYGLAKSIITGVDLVIRKYKSVIVLEDDLKISKNFLPYMNAALQEYEGNKNVNSISAFSLKTGIENANGEDVYFAGRPHSWGWGTWLNRWEKVDWNIDINSYLKDYSRKKMLCSWGRDFPTLLSKSARGKNDSWYTRFALNQMLKGTYTVYPYKSKVDNLGFGVNSTHCSVYNRNIVDFDTTELVDFKFSNNIVVDQRIQKRIMKYKSVFYRANTKILTILWKVGVLKQKER